MQAEILQLRRATELVISFIRNRLSRLLGQAKFAIATALRSNSVTIKIGHASLTVPTPVPDGLKNSLIKGTYEYHERSLLRHFIGPQDRVLELGAAVGLLATTYAKLSPLQHVAVEANPALIPFLRRNLERNGVNNVEVVNALASTSVGTADFFLSDSFYSSSSEKRTDVRLEVGCLDIGTLIAKHEISILVCDIEGSEYEVLSNINLSRVSAVIVEVHEVLGVEKRMLALLHTLQDAGFEFKVSSWRGNVLAFAK